MRDSVRNRPAAITFAAMVLAASPCAFTPAQEPPAQAQDEGEKEAPKTIAEKTAEWSRHEGLITFHTDPRKGTVWIELPPPTGERGEIGQYLYVESLLQGLGSNPVGLDRGQLGPTRLVTIRRVGGRVMVEQENLDYRALSDAADERRAVRQSFATSIVWAGEIDTEDPDGRLLVDFTSFIVRDAHNVAARLKQADQGSFKLDEKRSAADLAACLAFPDNVEFEAVLTFDGAEPGRHVRSTTPTPESITLVQHHSFIRLPGDGYVSREHDPRIGSNATTFMDYAARLDEPIEKRWINRHRLEKVDPAAARSRVKEPIIYYVDRGAPEPVRTALLDGGRWWAEAFEEAGFIDAYRVELMPEGAHPLDVRYNVVQWVHRSTRGWSYGGAVEDPRTGEIIKGHVSLGSLRVRQDILLFEGLAGVDKTGTGDADDPVQLALARIRQLSAHEIGHTLGFAHNFAASTYAGRASVMDYPAPLIGIRDDGELDFSGVYDSGIGEWDTHCVRYAYSQFPPGADEQAELESIVRQGLRAGYRFMSDSDARPLGSAHPMAHLWDNGDDPVAALDHSMRVRAIALDRFGEGNIRPGRPLSLLHEVLVPVYLHHRYQLAAATKVIGGLEYTYALRGDGQTATRPIDPAMQENALAAVLACLDPAALDLPDSILAALPPRPFGYGGSVEQFNSLTDPVFDPLGAAEMAAKLVVAGVLQPDRCARLIDGHRRDPALPSLESVLERVVRQAFEPVADPSPRLAAVRHAVQRVVVVGLIDLAADQSASGAVRGQAEAAIHALRQSLDSRGLGVQAHFRALMGLIDRYLNRQTDGPLDPARALPAPPGDPIGMDPRYALPDDDWCGWATGG